MPRRPKKLRAKFTKPKKGQKRPPMIPVGVMGEVWDEDGLTYKQRRFVEALLGPACGNASEAARQAGYNSPPKHIAGLAGDVLNKPNVQEAIAKEMAKRRSTPEFARNRLIELCRSNMANFLTIAEGKTSFIDMAKAAEAGALGQLKEYKEEEVKFPGKTVIRRTVKIHDPTGPLTNLLKLHGLLNDDKEKDKPAMQIRIRRVVLEAVKGPLSAAEPNAH